MGAIIIPKKWKDCISKVKVRLRDEHPDMNEEEIEERAYKICAPLKKGHEESEDLKIKHVAEIAQGVGAPQTTNDGQFLVFPATLATVTISKNLVKYTEEALASLASPYSSNHDGGYEGAPIFKDHNVRSIDNIIGEVRNVSFDEGKLRGNLHLMAHRDETKAVKLGLVKHVSFQNTVEGVSCSICGKEYGQECTDHRLGESYDDETCYLIPKKLGAIELSLVPFGGIPEATIGETLEGFENRFNVFDAKKDDNCNGETEPIIKEDAIEDDNSSNKTFINEKEADLIKESSNKNKTILYEARQMSEDDKVELQYKQMLEKLELEKQKLEEELATEKKSTESFKEKERLRIEEYKKELIDEYNQYKPISDEKRQELMLFEVPHLKEFIEILKDTVVKEESSEEPMPKARVTTVGEKANPLAEEVKQYIDEALW